MIPGLDPTHQLRRTIENHAIQRGSSAPEAAAQAAVTLDAWIQQNALVMGYQTTLRWVAVFSLAALAVALAIPLTVRRAPGPGGDLVHWVPPVATKRQQASTVNNLIFSNT